MKSKKMFALSVVLIVCVAFFATAVLSHAAGDKVVLRFLHKWPEPETLPYFEDVVKNFEAQHPNIKIEMEAVADEPIKDKLRVMMGGTIPDIFFSWGGEFAYKFVRAGVALDLTPYYEKYPDWNNRIAPALMKDSTFDGKKFGVPLHFFSKFFTYNTEIFAKLNLKVPTNWDEFFAICEKLKKAGYIPISLGNEAPWAAIHWMTSLNQKFVPDAVREKDYKPAIGEFTHPGYVKALNFFKSINDRGYFNEGVNTTSNALANQLFYSGKSALVYMSQPFYKIKLEEYMPGKWAAFPMPAIADGEGNQNVITGAPELFMVSAKTQHPEEAVAFLRFMTSLENAEKLVKELGYASCVIGSSNEKTTIPQVIEMLNFVANADGMAEWLDTAVDVRIADKYLANVQLVLDGTKNAEEVMKEIQQVAKLVREEAK
jgi:raffinose/stachyose/melibiose transport system substrate-binding protein